MICLPTELSAWALAACLRIWGYLVAEAKDDPDTNMTRFARYMAICMMIAVGVKVLPSLGAPSQPTIVPKSLWKSYVRQQTEHLPGFVHAQIAQPVGRLQTHQGAVG